MCRRRLHLVILIRRALSLGLGLLLLLLLVVVVMLILLVLLMQMTQSLVMQLRRHPAIPHRRTLSAHPSIRRERGGARDR